MKRLYPRKNFLIILIAPSGGGKSTILRRVIEERESVTYSISYTTRKPRKYEKNGVDYFFVSEEEFLSLKEKGDFLEYAQVHNNWYGTSKKFIENTLNSGKHVILDVDVQGADLILQQKLDTVTIFLLPPRYEVLKNRLKKRGTDSAEAIKIRLENAKKEIQSIYNFSYLVINDDLEFAVKEIEIIIDAEENKVSRFKEITKIYYGDNNA